MGRDPCKLTKIVKIALIISLNNQANRHPNIFWTRFLKSASKLDLTLKKWDVNNA